MTDGGMIDIEERDIGETASIEGFIGSLETQEREMILTKGGKAIGAILTGEQYDWFLDLLDAQQDLSFINERVNDLDGSQTLEDFKKELEDDK
jgi:hypothetical protein